MKKITSIFPLFVFLLAFSIPFTFIKQAVANEELRVIQLPDPKLQFEKYNDSLLFALENRRTTRTFSKEAVDINDLSALLWAAAGVTREDGKLTIPTSKNSRDMLIYVLNAEGIWLYNANKNTLEQKSTKDIYQDLPKSPAKNAPLTLVYVQDMEKGTTEASADKHAGSMYQNVGLYCAIAGLNNVVVASYPKSLEEALALPSHHRLAITQSIGGNL